MYSRVGRASGAIGRRRLLESTDGELFVSWTLRREGHVVLTLPRISALRMFLLHHVVHHRGQLTVYLRMLDKPVPATYGPTADVTWQGADPTTSVEAAQRK
jgi:uncharacterized damage-inducible protein DinB